MDFSFIADEGQRQQVEEVFKASISSVKDEVKTELQKSFNEQVEGLKSKNSQLLDEKKKIQETLKNFDGLDPEKAKQALELINGNEEIKLIQEGKFEEVVEKRVSSIKQEHEQIVEDLSRQVHEFKNGLDTYKSKFESKMIDDSIREAALKAKVRPEAIEDILNKGRMLFNLAEDGFSVESRTKDGKLRKIDDDKVMTTSLWVDSLKQTSPHYWPPSTGGRYDPDFSNMDDLDIQIATAAKEGDNKRYRMLRDKKKKMSGG